MLTTFNDDSDLLRNAITGDESWVHGYDIETKSSQWKLPEEPRPKKTRQDRSNVKVLLSIFFNCNGVVHNEFLPQGRTVFHGFCIMITHQLSHRCLWVSFWPRTQPPHSPDLASADFFFWRHRWMEAFCHDWGDKRKIRTTAVGDTKKRVSECFENWKNPGISVLYLRGVYFERNKRVIDK